MVQAVIVYLGHPVSCFYAEYNIINLVYFSRYWLAWCCIVILFLGQHAMVRAVIVYLSHQPVVFMLLITLLNWFISLLYQITGLALYVFILSQQTMVQAVAVCLGLLACWLYAAYNITNWFIPLYPGYHFCIVFLVSESADHGPAVAVYLGHLSCYMREEDDI